MSPFFIDSLVAVCNALPMFHEAPGIKIPLAQVTKIIRVKVGRTKTVRRYPYINVMLGVKIGDKKDVAWWNGFYNKFGKMNLRQGLIYLGLNCKVAELIDNPGPERFTLPENIEARLGMTMSKIYVVKHFLIKEVNNDTE